MLFASGGARRHLLWPLLTCLAPETIRKLSENRQETARNHHPVLCTQINGQTDKHSDRQINRRSPLVSFNLCLPLVLCIYFFTSLFAFVFKWNLRASVFVCWFVWLFLFISVFVYLFLFLLAGLFIILPV